MSQYLRSGAPWLPCGVAKYPFKISHLKVNAGRCIAVLQDTTEQFFRQIAPFCHTHVCGECCTKELQKGRQLAHLSGPNNDWGATMFPSMDKRSPSCPRGEALLEDETCCSFALSHLRNFRPTIHRSIAASRRTGSESGSPNCFNACYAHAGRLCPV
jgi:hypothetical protein